eukprot:scaffold266459_cov18-Prasinocladus_malaysianus.AAC.1
MGVTIRREPNRNTIPAGHALRQIEKLFSRQINFREEEVGGIGAAALLYKLISTPSEASHTAA